MPISIDNLDDAPEAVLDIRDGTQPHQVLQFLAEHDDQAFTQTEIADATGLDPGSVGAVLSRLEARSLVRHKGRYWAIAEDDRIASYVAQTQTSSPSTSDEYYGEGE